MMKKNKKPWHQMEAPWEPRAQYTWQTSTPWPGLHKQKRWSHITNGGTSANSKRNLMYVQQLNCQNLFLVHIFTHCFLVQWYWIMASHLADPNGWYQRWSAGSEYSMLKLQLLQIGFCPCLRDAVSSWMRNNWDSCRAACNALEMFWKSETKVK